MRVADNSSSRREMASRRSTPSQSRLVAKTPIYINGENSSQTAIQTAIDKATPGDMIIVGPGTYYELLLMWKPVRLQGVGAALVTINANPHPAGKLDPWRRQVNCLFGLALDGSLLNGGSVYDPTGTYSCSGRDAGGSRSAAS